MTTRRELLRRAAVAAGSSWAEIAAESAPPNIVFVLVDDLRWDDVGINGPSWIRTPNIDRLSREGIRFDNAFVTAPLCSPSRGCLLTGQYAHAHGILDNAERSRLSHQLVTLPRMLHDRGYETGFIGKWHMGEDDSPRPGFDYWLSMKGHGTYFDPQVNENGSRRAIRGYLTDIFNEHAVRFLKKKHEKPYCLWLAHKAVNPEVFHNPDGSADLRLGASLFSPAKRHEKLYANVQIPRRPNYLREPSDKPALLRELSGVPPLGAKTGTEDEIIKNRLRQLAAVDEGVGEMLKALKELDQIDRTFFCLTSDHGFFYGEHCLSQERRLAYEESIHVPLFMRYPRLIEAGRRETRFALGIDIAPTMLEVAGEQIPGWMHGRSLMPLLTNQAHDWRKSFLVEYFSDKNFPRINRMGYQAIRSENWKYIHYTELENMDELYDLNADPYEMHNVIDNPGANQTKEDLRTEMKRLLTESAGIFAGIVH